MYVQKIYTSQRANGAQGPRSGGGDVSDPDFEAQVIRKTIELRSESIDQHVQCAETT